MFRVNFRFDDSVLASGDSENGEKFAVGLDEMKMTKKRRVTQRLLLRGALSKGPSRPCLRPALGIVFGCEMLTVTCSS